MSLHDMKCLLLGIAAVVLVGCEPRPVVVEPDNGAATVVEEDEDVEVERDATDATPQSGASVDVNVGGKNDVDVEIKPGAEEPAKQNP